MAVDQHRHFGRAAEACHVTQPTLSMQIQKLEESLGVVLFDRNRQPILPTQEGTELIKQAQLIMNEHKRFLMMAQGKNDTLEGEFSLAVIPTVAPQLVPSLLTHFASDYPEIDLTISELTTEQIIESLDRESLDAGILATPLGLPRVQEDPLYYEPFYVFVHEKHEFAKLKALTEKMLKPSELWLPSDEHCLRNQTLSICKSKEHGTCFPNVNLRGTSLETVVELVESNNGYAVLPQWAAEQAVKRHRHGVIVSLSNPTPTREISLVHRRSVLKRRILKALRDSLIKSLPKSLPREKEKGLRVIGLEGQFK